MNKRQALFWSYQLWSIINQTGTMHKSFAIRNLKKRFGSSKIDLEEIFGYDECSCCVYVQVSRVHCSYCPGFSIWKHLRKRSTPCIMQNSPFRKWETNIDRRYNAKIIADGFRKLWLEECQKS